MLTPQGRLHASTARQSHQWHHAACACGAAGMQLAAYSHVSRFHCCVLHRRFRSWLRFPGVARREPVWHAISYRVRQSKLVVWMRSSDATHDSLTLCELVAKASHRSCRHCYAAGDDWRGRGPTCLCWSGRQAQTALTSRRNHAHVRALVSQVAAELSNADSSPDDAFVTVIYRCGCTDASHSHIRHDRK